MYMNPIGTCFDNLSGLLRKSFNDFAVPLYSTNAVIDDIL